MYLFQHVINIKIINKVFYILLSYYVFRISCVFYTSSMSPFRPATIQKPNSHMWLVAIVLDGTALAFPPNPPYSDSVTPLGPQGACWAMLGMEGLDPP